MVITGLTRNQVTGNRPWVRIPPSPPEVRERELSLFLRWDSKPERVRSEEKMLRGSIFSSEVRSGCAARMAYLRSKNASHRLRQR